MTEQQDVTAYFPFGEMAVTDHLVWKYEHEIADDIEEISNMRSRQNGWAAKSSKALFGLLRQPETPSGNVYGGLPGARRFGWAPRKSFAVLMANSKRVSFRPGRSCGSLFRLFHCVGFQHWNLSNVGTCPKAGRRERLTLQRCQQLGCIFMQNYESIKQNGISLRATRLGWQRHHLAIHFVYAGGSESPGPGTVIRYGSNIFYAMFDVGAFFNHGGSPSGEVPAVDEEALRRLTRETEIKKAAERSTAEEDTARLTPFTDEWTLPVSNKRKSSRRKMDAPYGDALVKTTPFNSLPTDVRKLLGAEYKWGNMLVELNGKAKAYSNGCKSPFDKGVGNDITTLLERLSEPKKDDPDYAAKLAVYKAFCFESGSACHLSKILVTRTDFFTQVSAICQAYGPDFFAYVQKHASDPNIRRKYKINTPEGKAHVDLMAYEPYEDFAVEEFIDKLLGPTIEEVDEPMNAAGSSTDAPSHSPSGETAGAAKQEPTSAPLETDAAEGGSASGDVSGVKVEQPERSSFEEVSGTKDVHMEDAGDTGKHDADEATGSSPPGEEPMPDINSSSSADASDEEKLHDQGIWGKQKNIVEPGAYEAEARATAEAEANNEQAFENIAGAKEKASLIDTDE
ncbi:unnamed protein product [Symbiodinium necroappetens]|uniref:Uncharacterized protein n=1 Tax=Symbiodinium necroappetens TaxID=1628268 RepID=A0A812Y6B3_9DINO|nr:unnamed protein product [Symbiodinium necroappetens]